MLTVGRIRGQKFLCKLNSILANKETPMREQTSELSLSGCYVKTMVTIPVGTKLDIGLWFGEAKVMISAIAVTSYPQMAMAFNFLRCLLRPATEYEAILSLEEIQSKYPPAEPGL